MMIEEIMGALKKIEGGKAAGMYGIVVEIMRIFNRYMDPGVVPEDWKAECIIPLCKGKGD